MFIFMGAGNNSVSDFDIADLLESSPEISIAPGSCPRTHIRRCNNHVFWGEPKRVENSMGILSDFLSNLRNCHEVDEIASCRFGCFQK